MYTGYFGDDSVNAVAIEVDLGKQYRKSGMLTGMRSTATNAKSVQHIREVNAAGL